MGKAIYRLRRVDNRIQGYGTGALPSARINVDGEGLGDWGLQTSWISQAYSRSSILHNNTCNGQAILQRTERVAIVVEQVATVVHRNSKQLKYSQGSSVESP